MVEKTLNPHVTTERGTIYFNPGSGHVDSATEENADLNIAQLVKDVNLKGLTHRRDSTVDGKGRFGYQLTWNQRDMEVKVPGIPMTEVRNFRVRVPEIWRVPRLYVDGTSWLWEFAMRSIRDEFENPYVPSD